MTIVAKQISRTDKRTKNVDTAAGVYQLTVKLSRRDAVAIRRFIAEGDATDPGVSFAHYLTTALEEMVGADMRGDR